MDQFPGSEKHNRQENLPRKPRILVAPLDWGLGHATRCIPVIHELLKQGCEVFLAGEGTQEALLKTEFPSLPFLSLPGYRVVYGSSGFQLLKNLFSQAPGFLKSIKEENAWLKEKVTGHNLDGVISDNRFGLYHEDIPCIFITHQLLIKTGLGKWMEKIVQTRNYHYIKRFTGSWVPDAEKGSTLAGELSHPKKLPKSPVTYIGPLSRFEESGIPLRKDHVVVILSGPEPQRSLLEDKMIRELGRYAATATLVRGLPGKETILPSTNMIRFYNHLPTEELNSEINSAEYVISRSGYSTVMDLVKLKKKSILIPTPGQPEQEYIGKWLNEKKIAVCVNQKEFSLSHALQLARKFDYRFPEMSNSAASLETAITGFIDIVLKKGMIRLPV